VPRQRLEPGEPLEYNSQALLLEDQFSQYTGINLHCYNMKDPPIQMGKKNLTHILNAVSLIKYVLYEWNNL
jgi:hypothetical protein